jgi:hypothetical protein
MNKPIACELVTWSQVEHLVSRLADKVRDAAYRPDIVIAIARGGYVPARLLCDHLDIFNLTSIRIVHYTGTIKDTEARLSIGLSINIEGLKVLVVDDVSDTGDTLQLALSHIAGFKPAAIKLAVMQHKTSSSVIPDFFGKKIVKWRWLTYPWAIYEDIGQFLASMEPAPVTIEEAAERLQQQHAISVPVRILRELLN